MTELMSSGTEIVPLEWVPNELQPLPVLLKVWWISPNPDVAIDSNGNEVESSTMSTCPALEDILRFTPPAIARGRLGLTFKF